MNEAAFFTRRATVADSADTAASGSKGRHSPATQTAALKRPGLAARLVADTALRAWACETLHPGLLRYLSAAQRGSVAGKLVAGHLVAGQLVVDLQQIGTFPAGRPADSGLMHGAMGPTTRRDIAQRTYPQISRAPDLTLA